MYFIFLLEQEFFALPEVLEGNNSVKVRLEVVMNKGYMYILECADKSYYTGSTKDLKLRLNQHQSGNGAKHTQKRLPVKLVYFEKHQRVEDAFYREKQVQGWSRKKKEALINGFAEKLPKLAMAYRDIQ